MIDFFIINNETKVPGIFSTSSKDDRGIAYRPCSESLENQAKELGVKINIKKLDLNEVPSSTKSLLVGFLCENNLIPDDYLARVMSLNNLYRSAYGFLGDHSCVYNNTKSSEFNNELASIYHARKIGGEWNKNSLMELTDEIHQPLIYGCIFNGYYYNSNGGFKPVLTPRTMSAMAPSLINKNNQLIWSRRLNIFEYIPLSDFDDKFFSKWFYDLGYLNQEKWSDNPDMLLFGCKFKDEDYKKRINFFKWIYDAGCYESFIGEKIG
jgi:hypothetical protein